MMTSGSYSSRRASMSPAFHASKPGSHDLHVLLRHRLLREADGFERFGPCVEVGPPEAPPAPPANHLPEHLLDRGVATRAVGTSAPGCERQVPPMSCTS